VSTLVERGHSPRGSAAQFLMSAVVGIVRLAILWRELRSARRLLQSMPDGVLSDSGISRGPIGHATAFSRGAIKGR
jgi:uncharacterized protein YjiS (DUF1127 family)